MPKKRQIFLYVVSEVFYPDLPGGARRVFRNGQLLIDRGVQVVVFTEKRENQLEDHVEVNGIKIIRYRLKGGVDKWERRAILLNAATDYWKQQGKPRAVLQLAGAAGWRMIWQLWKARLQGLPAVLGLTIVPDEFQGSKLLGYKELLSVRFQFAPFCKLLTLSEEMRRKYVKCYGLFGGRMEVVPNGVDCNRFSIASSATKRELRKCISLTDEDKIVLFVGAIVPRKRVDLLLEAWDKVLETHPEARLLVVGAEPSRSTFDNFGMLNVFDDYQERIKNILMRSGAGDSIHLISATEEVESYYQAADLFVLPSFQEGLPNVLLEAMASGLPALVSRFSGLPRDGEEIGIEGEHYYACVRNDGDWAVEITNALSDPHKCQRIGVNARKFVEDHQTLDDVIDRLANIYIRVTKK